MIESLRLNFHQLAGLEGGLAPALPVTLFVMESDIKWHGGACQRNYYKFEPHDL
jgi:hypothetical protein